MNSTTTLAQATIGLWGLCREARELTAAGPTVPSEEVNRLEERGARYLATLTSEIAALRALLERRDAELAQLIAEREGAVMLLAAGLPAQRCEELSELLKLRSGRREAAVAAQTGR